MLCQYYESKSCFQLLTMDTSRPAGWMTLLILHKWEYKIFHILVPLGGNLQLIWKAKEISRSKILLDRCSKAIKEFYITGWRNIFWSRNMTTRWNAAVLHGVSIWVCLHCQKNLVMEWHYAWCDIKATYKGRCCYPHSSSIYCRHSILNLFTTQPKHLVFS